MSLLNTQFVVISPLHALIYLLYSSLKKEKKEKKKKQARHATSRNSGTPVAYQGLKITTSLSSRFHDFQRALRANSVIKVLFCWVKVRV
ncbi:hypothetical protein [Bathymodiolus japonicus methanotrophic gill symbiont]|uniref:hypothetical protein n=1 Tax=Bathymodiolus japonicus methanotrophic gill symbiont TaxID=113269 RepID=UPI001C8EDBB0|nr:hypothetical protein [Bathymodiolus japonicus methanotrophic gill symbiont]